MDGLRPDHPCGRMHGHNYIVRVEVAGDINEIGFVIEFADLDKFGAWIDDTIGLRVLNDVIPVNTTVEQLARWLGQAFPEIVPLPPNVTGYRVRVSETPKVWATWEPQ